MAHTRLKSGSEAIIHYNSGSSLPDGQRTCQHSNLVPKYVFHCNTAAKMKQFGLLFLRSRLKMIRSQAKIFVIEQHTQCTA